MADQVPDVDGLAAAVRSGEISRAALGHAHDVDSRGNGDVDSRGNGDDDRP
jgi:hypothetical protein